jgi:hypothetical protein
VVESRRSEGRQPLILPVDTHTPLPLETILNFTFKSAVSGPFRYRLAVLM